MSDPAASRTRRCGAAVLALVTAAVGMLSGSSVTGAAHVGGGQAALERLVAEGAPGAHGEVLSGDRVWTGSAGVADRATGEPFRPDDRFRAGSITKTFVATVLLQLEAEHRLSLDDPVERWLPGLIRGDGNDGRAITVRSLLNQTSGLYDYTDDPRVRARMDGPGFLAHRYDTYAPRWLVRRALAHPPEFAAGRGWGYSNTNYVVAGMVIARVTGRPWGEEIRRRVIGPLGLRATSVPGVSARLPGPHGRAYSAEGDVTGLNPSVAGAAGSVISTTGDLDRFYRAVVRGELFPGRQLREMLTVARPPGAARRPGYGYGLGIFSRRLRCGVTVWGHDGAIAGSLSDAAVTRDGAVAATFHTNTDRVGPAAALETAFC